MALDVAGVLGEMQIQSGMSLLDGALGMLGSEEEQDSLHSAQMLMGIANLGASGFQLMKMLSSTFRKGCNSFEGGTLVDTEHGLKAIEGIQIGEKVWSFNEETGEKSLQEVIHLIQSEGEKQIIDITVGAGEAIKATSGHPFYVPGLPKPWVTADELEIEYPLLNRDGRIMVINDLSSQRKLAKVYNITVKNDYNYFVGESRVLSHNADGCKFISDINMRHILSGDKFGGGHSIHGVAIDVVNIKRRLSNGVYEAVIRNPVDGILDTKTFFPDSWSPNKIRSMINVAVVKNRGKGGRTMDFQEWVSDGNSKVKLRVVLAPDGKGEKVLTAHPIFEIF